MKVFSRAQVLASPRFLSAFLTLSALLVCEIARAEPYTYTGTGTSTTAGSPDLWNSGTKWTGGVPPVSGVDTILNITIDAATSNHLQNDIPGTFQLNRLATSFSASGNNQKLFITGNTLEFVNSSTATGPTININPTWSASRPDPDTSISNNLILTNNTALQHSARVNLSGEISGAGQLTIGAAAGTNINQTVVTLSNVSNTYSGGTTINGGTLMFANTGAMPTLGNITIASPTSTSLANLGLQVGGAGEFTTATAGAGSIGGVLSTATFNTGAGLAISTSNNGGGISNYGGDITGALRIIKLGSNTLELSGNNSFTGSNIHLAAVGTQSGGVNNVVSAGLIINGGSVRVSSIGNRNAVSSNAGGAYDAIVLYNSTLVYAGTGEITDRIIAAYGPAGSMNIDQAGTGTLELTGNFRFGTGNGSGAADKAITLIGSTSGIGHISGNISDVFSSTVTNGINRSNRLVKDGTGTWVLSGANTYSGSTTIRDGVLSVSSVGASNVVSSNLGGYVVVLGGSGAPPAGTFGTLNIGNTTTTGTLRYTGTGEVSDRVVNLGGTTGGAVLEQSGTAGHLHFTSNFTSTGAGTKTLTLQGSTAATAEISGAIVDNSVTHKTIVVKSGTGTWRLSDASTYSGGTTIDQGVLEVTNSTGSATGSGVVILGAATLAGNGRVDGLVNTSGITSVISAGTSPGTLNLLGGLEAADGATFNFELGATSGAPDSDLINLGTGVFTGSAAPGGLVFNFYNIGATTGSPYTLFTFGSSLDLEVTDIFTNALPDGMLLDTTFGTGGYLLSGTNLQVQFDAVPEPGSVVLALGALVMLVGFRRRRSY